jgi:hypothetical protein
MGLFGRKREPEPAPELSLLPVNAGGGYYFRDVVGESFHRGELLALAKRGPSDQRANGEVYVTAEVVPEPDNQYDPNAIAVRIGGHVVGHIAKDRIPDVRKRIDKARELGRVGLEVPAVIGWDTEWKDAPIGVRLDLPG